MPRHLRKHVAAIYCFARQADDLADEGDATAEMRLLDLQQMRVEISKCMQGKPSNEPVYLALANTLQCFSLPAELITDLISAFSQDLTKYRYTDFADLLAYCQRSANPIGRMLLHLHGKADSASCTLSDNICTALQLINFYQDIHQDYHEMKRIYIPLEDMAASGVTEKHFKNSINDEAMHQLMQLQYQRASLLLSRGKVLGKKLHGRFGLEIRLIIAGGECILNKLKNQQNPFSRPRLRSFDKLWILKTALLP
jgi:squalene synthase HpnC